MSSAQQCPECGGTLAEEASEGLCARCLLHDLLSPGYVDDPDGETPEVIRYFGDYEFLEQLSRGGMGTVFKARQVSLNRLVAVKLIAAGSRSDATLRKRFQHEAEAAARLQHPNIIPIYEFGDYGGEYFLVMKLVEDARSLVDLRLSIRPVVRHVIEIAHAVHYAHERGVLHRDIKPSNILRGTDGVCYLTDFGLAKFMGSEAGLTLTHELIGTPAYMAPEQLRAGTQSVTTAVDIYSLGATLYECLAGHPPFTAQTVPGLLRKILDDEPPPLDREKVDRDLATICLKCLEKNPSARYPSVAAFAEDLERWLQGRTISARPAGALERLGKWARRKPAAAALAGFATLALLVGIISIGWFNLRLREKNDEIVERVISLNIQSGARLQDEHDPTRAMLYFAEALRLAESAGRTNEVEMLRFRFAALLASSPRLLHLWRHEGGANDVQFSPDGRRLATGGNDGFARLWDVSSGTAVLPPLRHTQAVYKVSFSDNGKFLATVTSDAVCHLWNATNGQPRHAPIALRFRAALWTFGPPIISFDSSCSYLACAQSNRVRVVELESGLCQDLQPATGNPNFLLFRPGSRELIIATDAAIELWHPHQPAPSRVLHQPEPVRWVGFSPGGGKLAAILGRGRMRVWSSLENTTEFVDLQSPGTSAIVRARFLPGADQLVTVNFVSTVRVWSLVDKGSYSFVLPGVADLRVAPTFLAGFGLDGAVSFFDAGGAPLASRLWHGGALASIALHPSERKLAAACQDGSVRLWQFAEPVPAPRELDRLERPSFLATSRDGTARLSAMGQVLRWTDAAGMVRSLHTSNPIVNAAINVDGTAVAAICKHRQGSESLHLWNSLTNWACPLTQDGVLRLENTFTFSPDGKQVAFTFRDSKDSNEARIVDVATGQTLQTVRDDARIETIDFSPDDSRLLTGSANGSARVWDTRSGRALSPRLEHGAPVNVVAFSPDGRSFVTAGHDDTFLPRCAQVWDAAIFEPISPRLWHHDGILAASFSPDGRMLATGGEDNLVQLWNPASGTLLVPPLKQSQKVDCLAFSSDSRLLLVTCRSSYLRVYHAATGEPVSDLIPHGASEAHATLLPVTHTISYAAPHGNFMDHAIQSCPLSVTELRKLAETLSNHRLSHRGLERPNLPGLLE